MMIKNIIRKICGRCENCGEKYLSAYYEELKWCQACQINYFKKNFTNWSSENEKVDDFIQEIQSKINDPDDVVFEWIPYDQFSDIKRVGGDCFATEYSAIWNDGLLCYDDDVREYKRWPNIKVALKCLHNSQNITKEFLNKVRACSASYNDNEILIYGITQSPDTKDYIMVLQPAICESCGNEYSNASYKWCKPCQINNLKNNFMSKTSGNEEIDDFIQEMQLKMNDPNDIVFEWIPYNQFNNIEEIGSDRSATVYSAVWEDGPLHYNKKWIHLECLEYLQNIFHKILLMFGLWKDFKRSWTRSSSDMKVNLKCLYNLQITTNELLNEVKAYSTSYNSNEILVYGMSQNPDTKGYIMVLKYTYCEECGNAIYKWCKPCQINNLKRNFINWTSGNEKIDDFIQEIQLNINHSDDIIFEWIPYDKFSSIKEIGNNGFATIYLAIWKDGPLHYDSDIKQWTRDSDEKVTLKCLNNSQNIINEFLIEVEYLIKNSIDIFKVYGISQNPNTKDYIVILQDVYCEECGKRYAIANAKWCNLCQIKFLRKNFANWTSENDKVDDFIQEMQLKINNPDDIVFEWIPYNQFNDIKKIGNDDFDTVYSAIWKDGPLNYNKKWTRNSETKVYLNCLYQSQNTINEFLNKVKEYSTSYNNDEIFIYGISQNPDTEGYIIVLQHTHCEKCGYEYTNIKNASYKWCKPCQINYFIKNFTSWTSGNEKIDNVIQEMQLKINYSDDIVFEWISYNHFSDIKETGNDGFDTIYSAIWNDGPLYYNELKKKYMRTPDKKVTLRCFYNSQINPNDFLNEVKGYPISYYDIDINNKYNEIHIFGISQNPVTKNYIMVLQMGSSQKP